METLFARFAAPFGGPAFRRRLLLYGLIILMWVLTVAICTGALSSPENWLLGWSKWDSVWYARIWSDGYSAADPRALVFPPGYALLVGAIAQTINLNFFITAMLINIIALFLALVLAAETIASRLNLAPIPIFIFALSSPASYFAFSSYSDSVFCLILWLALTAALIFPVSRSARVAEIALLFLAPWFRMTGYALASWLVLPRWSALAIFFTLAAWIGVNYAVTGDVFYFLHAQRLFLMPTGNFFEGLVKALVGLFPVRLPGFSSQWEQYFEFSFLPILYFVSLFATAVWLAFKKEWLLTLTLLAILVISHNQSFWRSVVRYDLPIAMLAAAPILSAKTVLPKSWQRELILGLLIGLQFLLQIHFAKLFMRGLWAF